MSRAEKLILDYTMNCSNEMAFENKDGSKLYHDWLTPCQALCAVEIAKEEIYEWLQKHLPSYIAYCNNDGVLKGTELYINDLKQATK
jgi:hypothetical protein